MKHVGNIIISLALSMIVILLSAGALFHHCFHVGSTQLVLLADIIPEDGEAGDCCGVECYAEREHCDSLHPSGCSEVTVVKLAPYNVSHDESPCFSVYPVALLSVSCLAAAMLRQAAEVPAFHPSGGVDSSPPSVYLHLLGILRI